MTSTTEVTREYVQDHDPPKRGEGYSVQLSGNSQTKEDIAQQLLSLSLSSPNINSYTFNINQPQGEAVIRHIRSSHDRLVVCYRPSLPERLTQLVQDTREAFQQLLQKQVLFLEKKDKEGDLYLEKMEKEHAKKEGKKLEWEVFSRIAQGMWVLSEIIIVKRNSPTGGQARDMTVLSLFKHLKEGKYITVCFVLNFS